MNFAYLLFSAYAGTWVFLELLINLPIFQGSELVILRCVVVAWMPLGFFFLNFAYALVGRKVDWILLSLFIVALVGSFIGVTTDIVLTGAKRYSFGVVDVRHPVIHTLFSLISVVPAGLGLFLISKKIRGEKDSRLRTPLVLVLIGGVFALSSAWIFNVFIPNVLGILDLPRLGSSCIGLFVVVVYLAMRRFNFLAISTESVAEELFQNIGHGLALLSPGGVVQKMNPSLASILNTNPKKAVGRNIGEIFPELPSRVTGKTQEIRIDREGETRYYTYSNSSYKESGIEGGTILNVRDITDDKRNHEVLRFSKEQLEGELQKQSNEFLQIQKMEAIGTLAGGIAHDFNNLLATILGFATAALDELPTKSQLYEDTKEIVQAAERARGIVAKISNFRPRSDEDRTLVDPSAAVNDALKLISPSLGDRITVKRTMSSTSNYLFLDETLFHQALLNLFTNAVHAMRKKGGELSIEVGEVKMDKTTALAHPPAEPGRYSRIVVKDSGDGIPRDIINKIFEPFFTTKEAGEGTGLGLATVLRMAKDSGGFVIVESEENTGSSFAIHLPIAGASSSLRLESDPPSPGGTENIYLIDDNEQVVRAGKRVLESLGYSVRVFLNALEALKAFKENPNQVDMIITDESMPQMSGTELSKELLKIKKDLPILLVSGGETGDKTRIKAEEIGINRFLIKPLTKEALATTVREMLDK